MISKEKLLGGYVKTDSKELVRLFLFECLKHEDIKLPYISDKTFTEWERFAVADTGTPCGHTRKSINGKEELTLEDFKDEKTQSFANGVDVTVTFTDGNGDSHTLQRISTNNKPKPKTKVTYELVTDMTNNEIAKAMIDGEVFYDKYGIDYYQWSGSRFINNKGLTASCDGEFYRKVERELDWKDEALNYIGGCKHLELHYNLSIIFADSVDEEDREFDMEFIKLCHLVAELTDKPE